MTTYPSLCRVYDRLKSATPTWDALLRMPPGDLQEVIKEAGLSHQKGPRIRAILARAEQDFGRVSLESLREMSDDEVERYLTALPGVGVKTARCVVCSPSAGAGSRWTRMCGGWRGVWGSWTAPSPTRASTRCWKGSSAPGDRFAFHVNALAHGRTTCLPLRPRCGGCPLVDLCPYPQGTGPDGERPPVA